MALTEKKIRSNATTAAFRKGKALYLDGGVQEFLLERDEENGITYLNGKVEGNIVPFYEVSADLDEKREFEATDCRCQCEAYRSYPGFCKHLVALQLRYIQEEKNCEQHAVLNKNDVVFSEKEQQNNYKQNYSENKYQKNEYLENEKYPIVTEFLEFLEDVEKINASRENNAAKKKETPEEQLSRLLGLGSVKRGIQPPKPQTDAAITRMLERISRQAQAEVYHGPGHFEAVEIEPQLTMDNYYGRPEVSFRVGGKKKYVVKSLEEFVERVENREYFEYGKNLAFQHSREQFAKSSLPILDFISEYIHMRGRGYVRSFYHAPATRDISLNNILFERFMLAMEESEQAKGELAFSTNMITISGGKAERYYLKKENPDFVVTLEKVEDGAFLHFPDFESILGPNEIFIVEHNMIYHCSPEFEQDMRIVLEQFDTGTSQELFIENEDLQSVCANIIPLLEQHFSLEEKNISVEEYQPPEVQFLFYLDDDKEIGVTCKVECQYGSNTYRIFEETDRSIYRDVQKEAKTLQVLHKYFVMARRKNSDFMLNEEDMLYELLLNGIEELNEIGQVYATESFRKNEIRQTPGVDLGVSIKSDLLNLSVESEQLPYEELDAILGSYKMRKRYHRLKNGQFLELEDSSLSVLSELADGLQISGKDLKRGKIKIPKHRALYVDAVLRDAGEQVHVHRDNLFKGLIRNIKNVEDSDYEVPKQQYSILRSYQKKGYRWLRTIREYGFGGILADDMGLGKTLQMITLFQSVKEEWQEKGAKENTELALVVCPASLVYNWESEIAKFAPDLSTLIVSGSAAERKKIIQSNQGIDVWITSYDLLKRDVEWYQERHFDMHVIDEAQYIKNASTQAAKAVKNISSNTRLALTGTPIENRLSELWSIFDFLMPGLLFSYKKFKEEMESSIIAGTNGEGQKDTKALNRLKNIVRPFILRRLKEDVLKDLPKKLEHVVYAKMEGEQQKLYDARVQRLKMSLEKQTNEEYKSNKIEILSELTRLRQLCCDPALCYEDYKGGSAKLAVCMETIEDAVSSGHKVLLFSQFTSMLEILAKELKKKKIAYYELTGETKKEKRVEMAKAFNENKVPVFLISLRAGGTGLNLVGADIVIHFDPWWNLAAQNQATDRAHRIGQKNVVTVFKMITAKTIEEKILALQEKKKNLADQIISDEGMSEGSLTREQLLEILS